MAGFYPRRPKRELLYTMNGEPIYRDELRPIGTRTSDRPWGVIFYSILLTGMLVLSLASSFLAMRVFLQ